MRPTADAPTSAPAGPKQQQQADEEGKDRSSPSPVPGATAAVTPGGAAPPAASPSLGVGQGQQQQQPASMVDDLIGRGISPAKIRAITLVLACANAADAVEVLAVGFFLTVYKNSRGEELSSLDKEVLTGSIYMGMLIGGVVGGWLSDHIGRKRSLLGSLFLNGAAGLLSAAAPSLSWLALFRVLAGIGVGASVPCLFTLGAELFPVHSRGVHLSYIASFWMVGSIYAAVAAWILLGDNAHGERIMPHATWRAFVVVAALPVFITLGLAWGLLPESPRYLIGKGQYHAAAKSLKSLTGADVTPETLMAGHTQLDHPDGDAGSIDEETDPLTHPHLATATTATTSRTPASLASKLGLGRIGLVFSGPLRLTTARLMVVWFTLCFGTYGLNTWISTIFRDIGMENEFLPTFLFALANGPGNLASFLLIERLGRKRLLAHSMLLAALSSFLFALTSARAKWVAVVAACLFQAFSVAGWNSLDALSTESFPTSVRTTGMGLLSGTGRLASLIAMIVNGSLEHSVALLFAVTGSFTILGAVTSYFLPYEPTGMSLDGSVGERRRGEMKDRYAFFRDGTSTEEMA